MTKREVSSEEVQEFINETCRAVEYGKREGLKALSLERVDTEEGILLSFSIVEENANLRCLYDPAPAVRNLLITGDALKARAGLLSLMRSLPRAVSLAVSNAADVAQFEIPSLIEGVSIPRDAAARAALEKNTRQRRIETLQRMNDRNKMLVNPPATGKESLITEDRLAKAVGTQRGQGKKDSMITTKSLAIELNCTESAIYKQLERQKETLEDFLRRCS
jgi:hypothetical protein